MGLIWNLSVAGKKKKKEAEEKAEFFQNTPLEILLYNFLLNSHT